MTAKDILTQWLTEHGYDGLCGDECGCAIEDLGVCEGSCLDCVPGYKVPDPTGESRYLIVEKKEAQDVL